MNATPFHVFAAENDTPSGTYLPFEIVSESTAVDIRTELIRTD